MTDHVATAEIVIAGSPAQVWSALTEPAKIKQYFFGTTVETDWQVGSPIVWTGDYEGKPYEDKGEILEFDVEHRLQMTHFSPLTGQEDRPENYHTVTYHLHAQGDKTELSLSQDHNASEDEADRAKGTWAMVLDGLKKFVEAE
jgi:uncharacterized protein YndB with AHSA1/START domain